MFCTESTVLPLESILEDPISPLFEEFATFVRQSYCLENLDFWLATQVYYEECNNPPRQRKLCDFMINLYIRPGSNEEINIPCEMRQTILNNYHGGNLDLDLFDDAAHYILELMRVNLYIPWAATYTPSYNKKNQQLHKSWSTTQNKKHVISTSASSTSLSGLATSFFFLDKLIPSKQTSSRKSCSSLEYVSSIEDDVSSVFDNNNDRIFSVSSATEQQKSRTRYRSMFKRVKKSFRKSYNAE